jgi:hypothetical protein
MGAKNPVGDKATAVVADDWKETLKRIGGSQSDDWNHVLGNQAIQSLWINQSDNEVRQRQYNAAITGLIGIAPQDEIEGMIAAQLIAAHNATMECYRRAMIGEQTLEGRRRFVTITKMAVKSAITAVESAVSHSCPIASSMRGIATIRNTWNEGHS